MKKIMSLLLALSLLVACMTVLSSCGAPADAGAEISVYLGEEIYDFDPTEYYVDSNADQVMNLLYEPLFTLSSSGKLEYAAANKYTVDKEERKIVIELRETYWSDEIRVTASDFVYSWRNVLLNPNNANPAAALLFDIENAEGIKNGEIKSIYDLRAVASDTYEITITYREGADYNQLLKNLASIATSPLREDIVTDERAGYWSKVSNYSVTNGPFRLATVDYLEGSFTVARNMGYHQDPDVEDYTKNVTPNKIVSFYNVGGNEINVSYADLEEKTVFYMSEATLADRKANKDKAIVSDDLSTYTYVFNLENPLFAIKEVRQALSLVIDRKTIAETLVFAKAATGLLPDTVKNTANNKSFRTKDNVILSESANKAEAEALLKSVESSLADLDKSFTLTVDNNEADLAVAAIVEAAWEGLGFDVTVKAAATVENEILDFATNTPITVYDSGIQTIVKQASRGVRNFDVIGIDWQMYSTDAFVALASFSTDYSGCGVDFGNNNLKLGSFGGYSSAAYHALIEAAYSATKASDRNAKLVEAEKLLLADAAVAPVVYNQNFAFVSRDLSGLKTNGLGNFVFTKFSQKNYRDYIS